MFCLFRAVIIVYAAIGGLFLGCCTVNAQDLLIVPEGVDPVQALSSDSSVFISDPQIPGVIQFRAWYLSPDGSGPLDVTHVSNWFIVDGEDVIQIGNGLFVYTEGARFKVTADFMGLQPAEAYSHWRVVTPDEGEAHQPPEGNPPVYTEQEIRARISQVLDALENLGFNRAALSASINSTSLRDDNGMDPSGFGGSFLGRGNSAVWLSSPGFYFGSEVGGPAVWLSPLVPNMIVLSHDVIDGLVDDDGSAKLGGKTQDVIHEVVHDIIDSNGVDIPNSDETGVGVPTMYDVNGNGKISSAEMEEFIVHELITGGFFTKMVKILELIEDGLVSQSDAAAIGNMLRQMRDLIDFLRSVVGDDVIDEILELLGWGDANGNGIPDFIEALLELLGIDVDALLDPPCDMNPIEASGIIAPVDLELDIMIEQMYLDMGAPTIPLYIDDYRDPNDEPTNLMIVVTPDTTLVPSSGSNDSVIDYELLCSLPSIYIPAQ